MYERVGAADCAAADCCCCCCCCLCDFWDPEEKHPTMPILQQ